MEEMTVCWLSAGVSSFIAGWLVRNRVDKFIYIDIDDQHPDSMRFIKDCEKAIGKQIEVLKSENYPNVEACIRAFGTIRNIHNFFYPCTNWLKKRVRKEWEWEHRGIQLTYIWGMDMNEQHRADRLIESDSEHSHIFPLIDHGLTKQDAHGMLKGMGIKRPAMYDMGYSNNNCIGCVRGGKGYWNKIRIDFPEVFTGRAKMEREIGNSILKDCYLDELPPDAGNIGSEILEECSIFCMIAEHEQLEAISWD